MKTCSYCGRENEDDADVCSACGTGMPSPAPAVDPELNDPAKALVIVRSFGTEEQASLLAARLAAAGIEACIPEAGTQPFSQVIPPGIVTVRVAAKDREAAKAIAAGMSETEPVWAATSTRDPSVQPPRLLSQCRRLGQRARLPRGLLTRGVMLTISPIIVGVPIVFGVAVHSVRATAAM